MAGMSSNVLQARRHAWSTYWAAGMLHSCPRPGQGNYVGAISTFWRGRFEAMPVSARVLDLGTGNGALPLMLSQWSQGQSTAPLTIDAVDFADIAPDRSDATAAGQVTFHPRVMLESLPFPDSTFDCVVSQYGLEYAAWPQALHEILRVAKPAAQFAFVMHHGESVLVDVARTEAINQHMLLADDGLFAVAADAIGWLARRDEMDLSSSTAARTSREQYNQVMRRMGEAILASPVPDLLLEARQIVHGLVAATSGSSAGMQLERLSSYRQGVEAGELRSSELVQHALDRSEVESMMTLLAREHQARCQCSVISQAEGVLGWAVVVDPGPGPGLGQGFRSRQYVSGDSTSIKGANSGA